MNDHEVIPIKDWIIKRRKRKRNIIIFLLLLLAVIWFILKKFLPKVNLEYRKL